MIEHLITLFRVGFLAAYAGFAWLVVFSSVEAPRGAQRAFNLFVLALGGKAILTIAALNGTQLGGNIELGLRAAIIVLVFAGAILLLDLNKKIQRELDEILDGK